MFEIKMFDEFTWTMQTSLEYDKIDNSYHGKKWQLKISRGSKGKCLKLKYLIILCQPNRVV